MKSYVYQYLIDIVINLYIMHFNNFLIELNIYKEYQYKFNLLNKQKDLNINVPLFIYPLT